jgi:HK97 family phage major capsid protein
MPALATGARSVVFADWSQLIIRDAGAADVIVLKELYATVARTGFRVWQRVGASWLHAGVSPAVVIVQA